VLAKRVRLVVGTVARIDAARRGVELEDGGVLGYDYLVYAVGSGSGVPDVPGAAEFAYPTSTLEQARRLRPVIEAAPAAAALTVVGAGPTGIEVASELAEAGRAVTLVCGGDLGPYLHPKGRRSVAARMRRLGVKVVDGPGTMVTEVTGDRVRLSGGRELPSDVTIWTAGFSVPDLAARSGLSTDALGRLLTDETLTSVDDERIVATGDAAAPSDLPYRMSCQSAMQLGPQAAQTVLRRIAGAKPTPVDVGFFGECISLGRRAGITQLARRDDTATRWYLSGLIGAPIKEVVCRSTIWQLILEARKPAWINLWFKDARRPRPLGTARPSLATRDR
jgi:NADH dehydrogenase FAD-containing subunit